MPPAQRFAFRYGAFRLLLSTLAMGPSMTFIAVDDQAVRVRFGWAFRATIPRSSIRNVSLDDGLVGGIGVHGWRGRWLVNGAATELVRITIDPPVHAFAVLFPVRLRELRVSLEDRNTFVVALRAET